MRQEPNKALVVADDTVDLKKILTHLPEQLQGHLQDEGTDALSLPKGEDEKHLRALQATVDLGSGQTRTAVVLPADQRCISQTHTPGHSSDEADQMQTHVLHAGKRSCQQCSRSNAQHIGLASSCMLPCTGCRSAFHARLNPVSRQIFAAVANRMKLMWRQEASSQPGF